MDYMAGKKFSGFLSAGASSQNVEFSARIDEDGEVRLDFGGMVAGSQSFFIRELWKSSIPDPFEFNLQGIAADDTSLITDSLNLTSVRVERSEAGYMLKVKGFCNEVKIKTSGKKPVGPVAKLLVRGFQTSRPLAAHCSLGSVRFFAPVSLKNLSSANAMSGRLQIDGGPDVADVQAWRMEVEKLFDHVLNIMSFASGTALRAPVFEFIYGGEVELVALSQVKQELPHLPPFSRRDLAGIFGRAVETHFNASFSAEKIHHAIGWYCVSSPYDEVNHVTAMTVLESLISANLSDEDKQVQNKADFKKLRKKISNVVKDHFESFGNDPKVRHQLVAELNEKLSDLNRSTLKQKLDLLAAQLGMNMDGISDAQIKGVKKARDRVVHRGFYESPSPDELLEHMLVARELVTRLILTVLGYEGAYRTYIGGFKDQMFRGIPQADLSY